MKAYSQAHTIDHRKNLKNNSLAKLTNGSLTKNNKRNADLPGIYLNFAQQQCE